MLEAISVSPDTATGFDEDNRETAGYSICPNPFNDKAIISFTNPGGDPCVYILRDITGKIVETRKSLKGESLEEDRDDLNPGIYIFELIDPGNCRGKLIIE